MPTQGLQIETWPIERLIPYARNARLHSEARVAQIAASVRRFGFNNPILVGPSGGHCRGPRARTRRADAGLYGDPRNRPGACQRKSEAFAAHGQTHGTLAARFELVPYARNTGRSPTHSGTDRGPHLEVSARRQV